MLVEASLKGILGEQAQQYYQQAAAGTGRREPWQSPLRQSGPSSAPG